MANYKVIQDIESEDKLLGPLTLRQFIYAVIVIVLGFISFKLVLVQPLMVIPLLPPMIFFAVLAAPFGHDQSSEVWLLAKIRFFLKPRRRIWDQSGLQELVTITVPKKIERHLTDGLTQSEVRSRLSALANTIDSRGWAVKNVNVNLGNYGPYADHSDRLVAPSSLPQEVSPIEVYATDDMMDTDNNPTAQHLDSMISQSETAHRQALIATVQNGGQTPSTLPQEPQDYWFMNQVPASTLPAGYAAFASNPTITPHSPATTPKVDVTAEDAALLEKIHKEEDRSVAYGNTKVLRPTDDDPAPAEQVAAIPEPPLPTNPEIARLATDNNLNISTLARQANKSIHDQESNDGEVVINLH